MAVAFYMDEHVPLAVTRELRRRGIDVLRVQDDAHASTDDAIILDRAAALGRAYSRAIKISSQSHSTGKLTGFRSPVSSSPTSEGRRSASA